MGTTLRQGDVAFQAQLYEATNPTRKWLHTARREWVTRAIDQYLPSQGKVLEVGVGAGVFTRHLAARSCQVLAVDINPSFLHAVAELPGVEVRQADIATLDDVHGFNLAVFSEVLEHIPPEQSKTALQHIHQALCPGGILVLTTPQAFSSMEVFARLLANPFVLSLAKRLYGTVDELGHINLLTRRKLGRQLQEVGFQIIEEHLVGLYVPVMAEFGGSIGKRLAATLADIIRRVPVASGLLWTQCYVLRKP